MGPRKGLGRVPWGLKKPPGGVGESLKEAGGAGESLKEAGGVGGPWSVVGITTAGLINTSGEGAGAVGGGSGP